MFTDCGASGPPLIRIGDKWTARIIRCLESGPRRFSELQVPLPDVTPKVLTETLRAMERDGLVERTAYAQVPPRVEYALTPLGRSLSGPMAACCAWSAAHRAEVEQARDAYAERTDGVLS
jgi:DNA-binding HxlR family transcriptional regulator